MSQMAEMMHEENTEENNAEEEDTRAQKDGPFSATIIFGMASTRARVGYRIAIEQTSVTDVARSTFQAPAGIVICTGRSAATHVSIGSAVAHLVHVRRPGAAVSRSLPDINFDNSSARAITAPKCR